MYKINSNGWDYTIPFEDVDYHPGTPAITHRLPGDCEEGESEFVEFSTHNNIKRIPATTLAYDEEPNYHHKPELGPEFMDELLRLYKIEMVTGE
jgi:hypothetical protein